MNLPADLSESNVHRDFTESPNSGHLRVIRLLNCEIRIGDQSQCKSHGDFIVESPNDG